MIETIKSKLAAIAAARKEVDDRRELFSGTYDIRPVDCSRTLGSLKAFREPISSLCELMGVCDRLPESLVLLRYQLLVPLHYADEQASQLIPLISLFRSSCLQSSLQSIRHQQIIADKMDHLIRSSAEIEVEGRRLLDQARF
jgi:hypothetical protein